MGRNSQPWVTSICEVVTALVQRFRSKMQSAGRSGRRRVEPPPTPQMDTVVGGRKKMVCGAGPWLAAEPLVLAPSPAESRSPQCPP